MDASLLEITKLIGNYGIGIVCLAVLITLHIHNVRVAIPSIVNAARADQAAALTSFKEEREKDKEEREKERLAFKEEREKERQAFREELEKERTTNSLMVQTLAKTFKDALDTERANALGMIQSLAQSFKEELKAERDQCHEDHEKMMVVVLESRTQLVRLEEKQDGIIRSVRVRKGDSSSAT